jgi:hypothetical protein
MLEATTRGVGGRPEAAVDTTRMAARPLAPREHHRTTTARSIEETSRQGLDLALGSGFEHLWHERT